MDRRSTRNVGASLALCILASSIPNVAAAQVRDATAVVQGITVTGRGQVSVPPDRAKIIVRLNPRNVTGDQLQKLAAAVAGAMHAGGIEDAAVVLPVAGYLGPQSSIAVTGTVTKPTRESMQAIEVKTLSEIPEAVATALANAYQVQAQYSADDCSASEDRAVAAAIGDARARAERVAKASGLRLGAIEAVSEAGYSNGGCSAGGDNQNAGQADPYGSLSIPLSVGLTVRFGVVTKP